MNGLDMNTCDEISTKLSCLIGIFELHVRMLSEERDNKKRAMQDFSFFISQELQQLYKTVSGVDYYD